MAHAATLDPVWGGDCSARGFYSHRVAAERKEDERGGDAEPLWQEESVRFGRVEDGAIERLTIIRKLSREPRRYGRANRGDAEGGRRDEADRREEGEVPNLPENLGGCRSYASVVCACRDARGLTAWGYRRMQCSRASLMLRAGLEQL